MFGQFGWGEMLLLVVVGLFIVSLIARWVLPEGYAMAGFARMVPGWIGVVLALFSGWLGGELVETLGVSVRADAGLNAPSPLSKDRASAPVHRHA